VLSISGPQSCYYFGLISGPDLLICLKKWFESSDAPRMTTIFVLRPDGPS